LLTDEEIVADLEDLVASKTPDEDYTDIFEARATAVFEEEQAVEHALMAERRQGGDLLPMGMATKENPFARAREYNRIRREIRRRYNFYLSALDNYSYSAFLTGLTPDFLSTNQRRAAARQAAAEALRRERERARNKEVEEV
jgi:hypothetical protein